MRERQVGGKQDRKLQRDEGGRAEEERFALIVWLFGESLEDEPRGSEDAGHLSRST